MFEISLRKCSAEMNRVDKSSAMSDLLSIYGTLRDNCSLYEPSIRVKLAPEKMFRYNYAYIAEFNRYYFIKEVSTDVNGYVILDMVTDVLMTFKDQFKSCSAFVMRNQNKYNTYLVDKRLPLTNKINVSTEQGLAVWSTTSSVNGANGARIVFVLASNAASADTSAAVGGIKLGSSYGIYDGKSTDVSFLSSYRQPYNNGINVVVTSATTAAKMLEFLASRDKGVNIFNGTVLGIYSIPPIYFDNAGNDTGYLVSTGFRKLSAGDNIIYLKTPSDQEGYEFADNDTAYVLSGSSATPYVEQTFTVRIVDFLDLPPYTSYNLLLPYVGTVNISESWFDTSVATQTITVRAAIDWTLCEIAYYISVNDIYCTTVSGMFGSLIPFTTTNLADLSAQKLAANTKKEGALQTALVSGLIGGIGSLAMFAVNPAVGVAAVAAGAASFTSSIIQANSQYNATIESMVPRAASSAAKSEYLNCNTPKFISLIKQYTPKPEMSSFRALNGSPLLEFSTIGAMKGYTEFGVVHLDGVTALKPELEELERKFHEGVIL